MAAEFDGYNDKMRPGVGVDFPTIPRIKSPWRTPATPALPASHCGLPSHFTACGTPHMIQTFALFS